MICILKSDVIFFPFEAMRKNIKSVSPQTIFLKTKRNIHITNKEIFLYIIHIIRFSYE
jgi:hypothetical protein